AVTSAGLSRRHHESQHDSDCTHDHEDQSDRVEVEAFAVDADPPIENRPEGDENDTSTYPHDCCSLCVAALTARLTREPPPPNHATPPQRSEYVDAGRRGGLSHTRGCNHRLSLLPSR